MKHLLCLAMLALTACGAGGGGSGAVNADGTLNPGLQPAGTCSTLATGTWHNPSESLEIDNTCVAHTVQCNQNMSYTVPDGSNNTTLTVYSGSPGGSCLQPGSYACNFYVQTLPSHARRLYFQCNGVTQIFDWNGY